MTEASSDLIVDLHAAPKQSPRVVSRMVAGEHILVPLASRGADIDSIYNLNATGTFIWEKINGKNTGSQIAALVAAEFEVTEDQASLDCLDFLSQLLEVRAIEFGTVKAGK